MRQITSLKPQSRSNSGRVNLFLDDKFAFSLEEEVAAGLTPGSFLSEPEIADLQHQDGLRRAYNAALILLTYRPRSVSEVRGRLLHRGFDAALIDEALEKLKNQKVLDDVDFAEFWVDNRQTYNPRGGRLLQAELRSKGIDREIIESVLPEPEEEESAAYQAGQRKARSLRGLDWPTFRQRIGDHLVRRGFSYETAGGVARRLWKERSDESSGSGDES